ncbi:phosphoribosyltransferase [Streptomyces sp. NPDC001389]|uniref:phosphoribosyltransferase n=1 Tax=Streptomyces sp. NPDC001389 TaxID=3364569 RepID=UPI0036C0E70D
MTGRVFSGSGPFLLSDLALEASLDALASAVAAQGPVNLVIGIAGGGVWPAAGLAARLGAPVHRVKARHNPSDALRTQATGQVSVHLDAPLPDTLGGRILLVDDICGTGATFTAVAQALTPRLEPGCELETVAVCTNTGSGQRPNWSAHAVDDWVVFPWEQPPAGIRLVPLPAPEVRSA